MRILYTLAAFAGMVCGQQPGTQDAPKQDTPRIVSKMIPVHFANVNHVRELLSIPGVQIRADNDMHLLVLSGPVDAVETLEEMLKKLDVAPIPAPPHPDVELTVYLLFGSPQSKADEIPQDLASTVKQLHGSFGYKSYRMADSFVLRGRDGEPGHTNGVVAGTSDGTYRFSYAHANVSGDSPRVIRIDRLDFMVKISLSTNPLVTNSIDSGIQTSIDVREGQKVVVGKSSINRTEEALILVVTGKVVE